MELTGDILIAAPRHKVWAGLNDPEVLVRCIPGCEAMEATSPTERTARVAVKVGPVRARFVGHIRMEDVRENEGCTLNFEGSGGAAGMATRLREQREHALLWRQLTTIPLDVPLPDGDFARGTGDTAELQSLADWMGFGPLTRKRLQEAARLSA